MRLNKFIKITTVTLFITLATTFASCTSINNNFTQPPSWYINPQQNNSQFLYGIAQGYTMQEAKVGALFEASSRLSSSVSATTTLIREENNFSTNEEFRQNIKQNTSEIKFSNYKVINSQVNNSIFFVEIAIDRAEFIKFYKAEINDLYQKITKLDKQSMAQNIILRYNALNKISDFANQIDFYNSIIKSLGSSTLSQEKLRNIVNLQDQSNGILDKIEFYIDSNTPQDIRQSLALALNHKRIKIIKQKPFNKNQILIKAKISEDKKKVYGYLMNNITISLESWSQNKLLSSNKINVTGSSPSSYSLARKSAIVEFEKKIKQNGIFISLGIN